MNQPNPFEAMLQAKEAPRMFVVSKALAAFSQAGIDPENETIDPARALALLEKVFGEEAKYASIKNPENLPEFVTFIIDGIELAFWQGTTPEEDLFEVLFAGVPAPAHAIRTLVGLGAALTSSIDLAELSMDGLVEEQIKNDYRQLIGKNEEDFADDDNE